MAQGRFVARNGSGLEWKGKPFYFAGPNIYWLGLDENVDGVDWPTPFRIVNALDTAVEMGATVIRSHTLGASQGSEKAISPALGLYNEETLRRVDFVIHEAGVRGLKLIIPFVCNWNYYHGGLETFVRWRGLEGREPFYTNRLVIEDFKAYIAMLLNRVNTLSGVRYKDDPTIMAWELGNELNDSPVQWAEEIANYIKSIDGNHLVAHGKQFQVDEDKLGIEPLDIIDVHYYPLKAEEMKNDAEKVTAAGKVYIAGEFGWPQGDLNRFLEEAERNEAISGTLFWSLFGHHDRCGYVQHYDGFSLHYPGNGVDGDIRDRIARLRSHAFAMSGEPAADHSVPAAPVILEAGGGIAFRGSAGAAYYTLEQSDTGEQGPWKTIYDRRPADHHAPWVDPTRMHARKTWYRVRAYNITGEPGPYSEVFESDSFQP